MPLREQSAPQFGMAVVRMRSLRTKLLLVIFAALTLAQILANAGNRGSARLHLDSVKRQLDAACPEYRT